MSTILVVETQMMSNQLGLSPIQSDDFVKFYRILSMEGSLEIIRKILLYQIHISSEIPVYHWSKIDLWLIFRKKDKSK